MKKFGMPRELVSLTGATVQKVMNPDGTAFVIVTLADGREFDIRFPFPEDNNAYLRKIFGKYGVTGDNPTIQKIGFELEDFFFNDNDLHSTEDFSSLNLEEALDNFKSYFTTCKPAGEANYLRQFCILSILSPLLINAMAEEDKRDWFNPIIYIQGDSSIGKTIGLKYMMSFINNIGDNVTKCNATEVGLFRKLEESDGSSILLDELATMQGNLKKQIDDIIYKIADGYSKLKYNSDDGKRFRCSVFITTEDDVLRLVKQHNRNLGILGRVIGLHVKAGDLVDSGEHAIKLSRSSTKNNYAIALNFKKELDQYDTDKVHKYILDENSRISSLIGNLENVIGRWCIYLAILSLTAKILGNVTGVEFDIDGIINFITRILKKQFSFYVNSNPKYIAKEVHDKALLCAHIDIDDKTDGVKYGLVTPDDFKKAMNDIRDQYDISRSKMPDRQIKEILNRDLDLLKDTVSKPKNVENEEGFDKNSQRFYYLKQLKKQGV